jgi:acyl-coenzyme A thioesterase PaaI-like protein
MTDNELTIADWLPYADDGFLGLVGPIMHRREGDEYILGFRAVDKHRNLRDVVQGGMLMTLADRAMGSAVRAKIGQVPVATIQLDIHFIGAAQIGEFIEARGEVLRATASVVFVNGRLTVGDRVIADAKGVWKRLQTTNTDATPATASTRGNQK